MAESPVSRVLEAGAAAALECVLTNDPGTGVMRHMDAGYDLAEECARERGVDPPMLEPPA